MLISLIVLVLILMLKSKPSVGMVGLSSKLLKLAVKEKVVTV